MFDPNNRYESMLFNNETTNRTDLTDAEIKPTTKTIYTKKSACLRVPPPPLKFLHTLTDWRVPKVPIDLFIRPKEILHTNKKQVQQPYGAPSDLELEEVLKTRPRVFMIPAISMDDIEDPQVRQRLVDDVYTTTSMKAMGDIQEIGNHDSFKAPLPHVLAGPNPIILPSLEMPYVSAEWRMDSVSWDNRQLRAYADCTRDFWLTKSPTCTECKETAARDNLKKTKHI